MIPIKTQPESVLDEEKPNTERGNAGSEESPFLQLLRTASQNDINILAKLLMPYIAHHELREPRVWGDRARVHLDRATVHVNDLLLNTRSGEITIEADCFFGHRCMLLTGTHHYNATGMDRLKSVPSSGRDIHVERGVWMGSGVTVLGPAVIGENAVIAAGSLVVGDVAPGVIVAGHPAKPVKTIEGEPVS